MISKQQLLHSVSENVRRLMAERELGVRQLARETDTQPMTISRLVNAKCMPGADTLYRIALVFDVYVDDLFTDPREAA